MATVGRFAHSLHDAAGAPVRGAQARAMAMRGSAAAAAAPECSPKVELAVEAPPEPVELR